jgi:predicted ATPase
MRAASAAIVFAAAGEQELKGKTAPVPAWRALRIVAEVGGRNRVDGLEAPFVGRDDEMRELKDLYHGSARDRRVRLVSVIGPAGIGKSRLAWEFLKYMDGLVDTTWWHQGRSPAHGQGVSFWALGEMVRGRCKLLEGDDERTSRAKVAETLAAHVSDPDERRWLEPALLTLLGFGSGASSDQLFAAWRTFFERLAATAPVVMVFEDLHWADTGTLDFVDHLLDWSRGLPIFVLTLARPELLDRRPTWGAGKRSFASIHLEPLTASAMRALLAGLVPGLPEPAARSIIARADGMPLYAVETVRMLLAEGRLEAEADAYRVVGDLSALAVPETLTALIGARLDALDPADRRLLQDAAVLGQSFSLAALAAMTMLDSADLEPRLRVLVRRELLTLDADPRSPERGQYSFVQALIREVAYNTLARRDRRLRHLAAARYFESLGSDELVGALAGHYLAAHENAREGAEADALAAQARVALKAAADRAAALGSPAQAVGFLEQALTVTVDPAEEATLCERMAGLASISGMFAEGIRLAERALALHRASGDRVGEVRALTALGSSLTNAKRLTETIALLEEACTTFVDQERSPEYVAMQAQLARAHAIMEQPARALQIAEAGLEAAEHGDMVPLIADLLVTRGTALSYAGRYREGSGLLRTAMALAEAEGLTGIAVRACNNLLVALSELDPRACVDLLAQGLGMARRLGAAYLLVGMTAQRGGLALRTGADLAPVIADLQALLDDERDPIQRFQLLNGVVALTAATGGPVDGIFGEMQRTVDDGINPSGTSFVVDAKANAALLGGRPADARPIFLESHRVSPWPASVLLAARCSVMNADPVAATADLAAFDATGTHGPAFDAGRASVVAGLLALDGRIAESLTAYHQVRTRWRQLGLPFDEALTAIEMASVLDPAEPDVAEALDEARDGLRQMGAGPLLGLLDRTAARETAETPKAVRRQATADQPLANA